MDIFFWIFRTICKILSSIFFKEIHVFGEENVPKSGPIILSCNHNNQFCDAMLLTNSCERQINFIMALSSSKIKLLQMMLNFTKFIPTQRPIDCQYKGEGKIIEVYEKKKLRGENTKFTNLKKGDSIKIQTEKSVDILRIENILDDCNIELFQNYEEKQYNADFTILPRLDQNDVYKSVIDRIMEGHVIGIFPEGGSHDQTTLIELKPGACIFAFEAKKILNKDVKIVPVSINYFGAHKFRSKVIVNFGKPIKTEYDEKRFEEPSYKREKVAEMLEVLKQGMDNTKINAPSLKELKDIYCAKEIYLPDSYEIHEKVNFEILKKFCLAYDTLKDDKEVQDTLALINHFRQDLKKHSLKVSDLRNFKNTFGLSFWFYFKKIILLVIFTMPFLFIYLPLSYIIIKKAEEKRIIALKNSFVKIKGTDVLASTKIMLFVTYFPIIFFFLNVLFFIFIFVFLRFSLLFALRTQIDFFVYFPIYLYYSIILYDELISNVRIVVLRIKFYFFYNKYYTEKIQKLLHTRYELKKKLTNLLEKYKDGVLAEIIGGKIRIQKMSIDYDEKVVEEMIQSLSKNPVSIF
jgi:glycerol-3-phosphate O-acyltransferase/dihydroxyacetone phosphate acyltransferase